YSGIPEWQLTIVVNPGGDQRANEVRLVRQDMRSREAYPLWAATIDRVPTNRRAIQALVFIKDVRGRVHARCVSRPQTTGLPSDLRKLMIDSLASPESPSGVWTPKRPRSVAPILTSGPPRTAHGSVPEWMHNPPNWRELRRRGRLGEEYVLADLKLRYP